MDRNNRKSEEEIRRHFSEEKHKLEDSKLLSRIEELQNDIKTQIQMVQNEIRNLISGRTQQDELNTRLLSELHQIGELLQKLENAHQYTHKIVNQHEKSLEENRQLIHKIENEIQKIKSVLRVD